MEKFRNPKVEFTTYPDGKVVTLPDDDEQLYEFSVSVTEIKKQGGTQEYPALSASQIYVTQEWLKENGIELRTRVEETRAENRDRLRELMQEVLVELNFMPR